MKPRAQTAALAAIGIADLVSTLMFIGLADAAEANPLMARFLVIGPSAFIQAKLLFLLVPLAILELARRRNPRFVQRAVNVAIVAYIGLYTAGVVQINRRSDLRSVGAPVATQSGIDAARRSLGLPEAPPLKLLVRAKEQRERPGVYVPLYTAKPLPAPLAQASMEPARALAASNIRNGKAESVESRIARRALEAAGRSLSEISPL